MIDQAVLDGHKLNYHTELLQRWLAGQDIWPLYFEIGPTSACNNRCVFCAYTYLGHAPRYIDSGRLKEAMSVLAGHGAKSCMFAGEGEPLLHPEIVSFIQHAGAVRLEAAITTNLLAADAAMLEKILPHLKWLRCSLNAATAEQYRFVHQCAGENFEKVCRNLQEAVRLKKVLKPDTTVGVQTVILPELAGRLKAFGRRLHEFGVDYWSLKPCIRHPQMEYQPAEIGKEQWQEIVAGVREAAPGLNVIAREASRQGTVESERGYEHCLGLPFFAEIISDGRVFSCGPKLGDEAFCYGNINETSFAAIWQSERRRSICAYAARELDVCQCMPSCRLHQINRFLWGLAHPPEHVNFV